MIAALTVVLGLLTRHAQADLRRIPQQNVLLITIDTLRADALGSYGGPASTPALDRLANDGVRFTFAHAQAVVTLPAHASILTGQYPFRHGVRDNSGYRLAAGTPTLATMLKQAGYATGAFVAAFPLHSRFGLDAGFDVYDDHFGESRPPTDFVMPERPASVVVPLARTWIEAQERDGRRWFAWVHVFDPHAPYTPPPPFDREYAGRPYYGEVAAVDRALSALLDEVGEGLRPTLVVVTGDHGEALGDHGEATHGLFAYESTLRIPLIIAEIGGGRSRSAGGRAEVSTVPARHIDIAPTILDAVDRPSPSDLPGRTLLTASERREGSAARPSYFEAMSAMLDRGWAPLSGVVVGREKYIDLPLPELYDLQRDAGEQSNLASAAPDRRRTLQAMLQRFGAAAPGERAAEDPAALARLRTLGYVAGSAPIKARYTETDDPKRLVDVDRAIHQAVELYGSRRFREAAEIYRGIIGRRPDMAIAYRHLAFILAASGDTRGAVGVLREAIAKGIHQSNMSTDLGLYLSDLGETAEALGVLEPLARDPSAGVETLNALGIAYARSHRAGDARRMFERVLSVNPTSSVAVENLGMLALERGDLPAARQQFERAVASDARSSQAYAGLGVVARRTGDARAAIGYWRTAIQLSPANYDALYNLATTLIAEGQRDEARAYVDQFVRSAPPALYARDIRALSAMLRDAR